MFKAESPLLHPWKLQTVSTGAGLQSSSEAQLPSELSFPLAVPSSRWSTSAPWKQSLKVECLAKQPQDTRRAQRKVAQGTFAKGWLLPLSIPRVTSCGWHWLTARHFLIMRPQLKIQLQSTSKNSLLCLKSCDNDNPPTHTHPPAVSLCRRHTCLPWHCPYKMPLKQPCVCSWEVSYLPGGCLLPSGSAMCALSSHPAKELKSGTPAVSNM